MLVSFTERILQNLMQEFYILDLYVEVRFFLPLSALLWNILSRSCCLFEIDIVAQKWFFFFAKIISKEKTIDWNWSVYVVLKNSIIVFANGEKNAKSFLRWPGSRLSRQYVLTTLPNLLDKKKVFQSQTYFYIHMY